MSNQNLEPNYAILQEKDLAVSNKKELKAKMKKELSNFDLKQAAQDVQRFLFYPDQANWILDFEKHLENW